jgi:mTERF domain-containing protein
VDDEKTLLPKIEFFRSKGASSSDLPMILSRNPLLLARSLKNYIIPSYDLLKSLLLVDQKVLTTFMRSSLVDIANNMVPNISLLRQLGVPHSVICSFVMNNPRIAFNKHTRFVEAVNKVKEMGFDPMKTAFVIAIHAVIKQPIPESKLELYKRWGWSKDIALLACKRQPHCRTFLNFLSFFFFLGFVTERQRIRI